ncbi:uncharacterized protein LOC143376297 [Andrena cerasifolii]|uniref:uncharacterized protein LOC143376297 n=1 Tax=Andrena cerasifolii TaxID=2819439 RepID=UPI0040378405
MKCFVAIVLLAMFAFAYAAENLPETEQLGVLSSVPDAPRDKRGVLLSYSAPLSYPYSSPIAYTSSFSLPYAYRSYPYSYYNSYY